MIDTAANFAELFPESTPIERDTAGVRINWPAVPAKGAVYLLAAAEAGIENPILLATVGDLRAALKRRLLQPPSQPGETPKTKRIPYANLCTRIHFRRTDSAFAAHYWYHHAARQLFPQTYKALVPWRSSWWIAVERDGPFPKLRRTTDLSDPRLLYAGPVRDKQSAGKLIETLEDLFDLCRYQSELIQAPRGRACAYKEMGKCPAPCDGSVPISWYRTQMTRAWTFLTGQTRAAWHADLEEKMRAAAARLEFETANRLKQQRARAAALETKSPLRPDPFTFLRDLSDFSFVAIQSGQGKPWAEAWIIHGPHVECAGQFHKKHAAASAQKIFARYQKIAREPITPPLSEPAAEQIGLVSHHLFRGEDDGGIYLRGEKILQLEARAIEAAAHELWARKTTPKPLTEQSSEDDPLEKPPAPATPTTPPPPPAPLPPEIAPS